MSDRQRSRPYAGCGSEAGKLAAVSVATEDYFFPLSGVLDNKAMYFGGKVWEIFRK